MSALLASSVLSVVLIAVTVWADRGGPGRLSAAARRAVRRRRSAE